MRRLAAILMLGGAGPVAAHDFWVQPDHFAVQPGVAVPFTLQVGHGVDRTRWGGGAARIERFDEIGPKGRIDRRATLALGGAASDATLSFATPGTRIVVLATNNAKNDLPSIRFNDYLKAEGLTPAIDARARAGTTETNGRELYSRRAKALVRVGTSTAPQPWVTQPIGLTLEIIPQISPYALGVDARLPVQVLWQGKPLPGATVKLNNLDFDARPLGVAVTGSDGTASFAVPRTGRWQLNVVWTRLLAGNPDADFETVFSSLTFGFDAPR